MTKLIIIAVLALGALAAIGGIAAKIYNDGRQAERTAALTKGVELVKERDALDVKIKTATPADVCARLGGRWVLDNGGECD